MTFFVAWLLKDRQRLFAPLLPDQAFVFHVDGNQGEHTTTFLSLGERCVVAIEPPGDLAKSILISIPDEVALALPVFGGIQIERR